MGNAERIAARNEPGLAITVRNDRTGNAITFFGADAFDPSNIDEVVPHEVTHGAGVGKHYWLGLFGHDLSGYEHYDDIIANCKDH